jgi:hypothetical protein
LKDPDEGHVDANGLLELLRSLETELHRSETRQNRSRMESLLHPDFVELARSGRRYSRSEVLEEFAAGRAMEPVHARDFELDELAPGVALLTYRSAHAGPNGELFRHSLRSSLWMQTPGGWRMRFHQGTPTDAFQSARTE